MKKIALELYMFGNCVKFHASTIIFAVFFFQSPYECLSGEFANFG